MVKLLFYLTSLGLIIGLNTNSFSQMINKLPKNLSLIKNNDTKIADKPDTNSIELIKLNITSRVIIIKESNITTNEGWSYVDTQVFGTSNTIIKGWIKNVDLVFLKDFKKISKFKDYSIEVFIGDANFSYNLYSNGLYKKIIFDNEGNIKKTLEGAIYQYDNIISADYHDFFFMNESGDLFYNGNGLFKPIKAKYIEPLDNTCQITGDNVNVRAEAATNGAVLAKLSKGAKVTLLERSDVGLTVGDKKGYWAYVDTGIAGKDGEGTIKGWVFDYYLKEDK